VRVFIGFDPRESVACWVCANSILRHASEPVSFTFLSLNTLKGVYGEEAHLDGSNAFTYTRFLVPYLTAFNGPALYLDSDIIVREDIANLFALKEMDKDVMVVKHDYKTKSFDKYLGNKNADYPRKNWSSVMLFPNCANFPVQKLLPTFVRQQSGSYLHRFEWTTSERIGELPREWNHLVGEYDHDDQAKLLHYTLGAPCFTEYRDCDHADVWHSEFHRTITPLE
jgi:lipopolysaccharide biosynthesis glycosyltransferase